MITSLAGRTELILVVAARMGRYPRRASILPGAPGGGALHRRVSQPVDMMEDEELLELVEMEPELLSKYGFPGGDLPRIVHGSALKVLESTPLVTAGCGAFWRPEVQAVDTHIQAGGRSTESRS